MMFKNYSDFFDEIEENGEIKIALKEEKTMPSLKMKKRNLLLLDGIIWAVAGFNILRIGVISYKDNVTIINLLISLIIFLLFWFMVFSRLVGKHTRRILDYVEEKQFFLKFFDGKSFCIMAFMMTLGIGIRVSNLVSDLYIAVFYSGLGTALLLAGLLFFYNYFMQNTIQAPKKDEYE